jgi:hypothetical protein
VVFWYIIPRFGTFCQENLATLTKTRNLDRNIFIADFTKSVSQRFSPVFANFPDFGSRHKN